MAERTITLRIGATITGLQSQMRAATKSVEDFSKKSVSYIERNSASIDDLSNRVGAVGLGLTALATAAVTGFARFDKAMSAVAATGDDARGSIEALRSAAIDAGADTAFSAEEAANAIENLAKAGVSAQDILGGGLDGALALAAAGGLAVADAAEIAATALTQFSLSGADVPHVADLLAAGAGKAQGDVSDLSQALNQAGLIASQTGLSIEETTGALSAFASAGLLGSDAGTSFKTMLQVLSAPSTTAANEMDRLGISAYDAQGNFVGLEALAGNLQSSLAGLTDEQKSSALATIFGADAVRAASVIYRQGALGVAGWTSAVDDQGYAAEQARLQTDNLIGDLERLGGSLDSVFIKSGSGANDSLRSVVQGAESVVDAIGQIPEPVLSATTAIAGSGGLALLGVAGLGKLAVSAVEAKGAITALGISTRTATLAAGGLGIALAAGTIAFTSWAQNAAEAKARTEEFQGTLDAVGEATNRTLLAINEGLAADQNNWLDDLFGKDTESLIDRANRAGLAISDLQGYILGNEDAVRRVTEATRGYIAAQGDELTSADIRAQAGRFLTDSLDAEANSLTDAQKAAAQKTLADQAAGVAAGGLGDASEDAAASVDVLTEAVEDNWQATMDASGAVLSLRDAQRQAEAAYDDARESLKDNGATLDEATEKGRANQAALDGVASAGLDLVDSLRASGAGFDDVQGAMVTARKRFIDTATSMGMGRKEARQLADQLQLIPGNVSTNVSVNTGNALATIATIDNSLRKLDGKTVTAAVVMRRMGQVEMADGGPVTGGSAGKDSVPILGMPGEHMLTVRDVAAMGGQAGVYAFRAGLHGGVQRMAGGGSVDAAESAVRRAQRLSLAARRELSDARRDERRARSEKAQEAAEKRVARAERLVNERRDAVDAARGRLERLREEVSSLRTDRSRGDLRADLTSGMSGVYGRTDQARDLLASGDLTSSGERGLRASIQATEKAMRSLYKQADQAANRLETLSEVASEASSAVTGGFSLSDAMSPASQTNTYGERWAQATSGRTLLSSAQGYASRAQTLVKRVDSLRKRGFTGVILSEVVSQGVEGGIAMADALLQLNSADAKALNAAYKAIGSAGRDVGQAVSEGYAKGGLEAAEAQVKAIDKRIGSWADRFAKAYASALGIKARAAGGDMTAGNPYLVGEQGPELVFPNRSGYVLTADATRRLATQGGAGTQGITVRLDDGALARAMAGTTLTLSVDGQQMRAHVEAVAGGVVQRHEAAQDRQAQYVGSF